MTKRQQQFEETKKKIWDTGKTLISEKGYDSVSISDITDACGLSTGNFYHYFKSKDAFFAALEQEPYNELNAELRTLPGSTLEDRLTYYIEKRFAYLKENGVNFTRQWIRHAATPAAQSLYSDDKITSDIHMVTKLINDAKESGELREDTPAEALAQSIILTLFGTTLYYAVTGDKLDLKKWTADLCSVINESLLYSYRK